MLKDKLKMLINKNDEGNDKKKIENIIVFILILIVTLISIKYIWSGNKGKKEDRIINTNKKLASAEAENNTYGQKDNLSIQLEEILSKMKGVGKVNVLITYSQTNTTIPLYNEDSKEQNTEEKDTSGGTRKIMEKNMKKDIVYEEKNGEKHPITQSVISPKVEGAIITAEGADDINVRSNIIEAVEAVTGVSVNKIQVFDLENK